MGTLECRTVHAFRFPHLQEYYEHELTPPQSLVSQSNIPQTNFQKVNKTKPELFDEQEDSLDTYNLYVISKDFFVDMHGKVDKLITAISFENVPRTKKIEQTQQTLMKEASISMFVHQE
jgi:hypothetical protein